MALVSPPQLHKMLNESFNLQELMTLCFNLDIVFENLGGEGLSGKALALVQHTQRHGLYEQLVQSVNEKRALAVRNRGGDASGMATQANPSQSAGQTGSTFNFYGPVTGSAIGEGSVNAENIAGRDITIHNYAEPMNKAEFAEQLAQLEALLKEAIASGEIEDTSAVEDVQDAIAEAKKPEPSSRRLKNRLEDVKEVVEGAGGVVDAARKVGSAVFKALSILSGLIRVVTTIF